MKYAFIAIATYSAMVLQTSPAITASLPTSVGQALVVSIGVAALLLIESWPAIVVAALIGLTADLITSGPPGIHLATLALAAFCVQWLQVDTGGNLLRTSGTALVCLFLVQLISATARQSLISNLPTAGPLQMAVASIIAAAAFSVIYTTLHFVCRKLTSAVTGNSHSPTASPSERWLASG